MKIALLGIAGWLISVVVTLLAVNRVHRHRATVDSFPSSGDVLLIDVTDDVPLTDPALRRLIEGSVRAAFTADRALNQVTVRSHSGRFLARIQKGVTAPIRVINMPRAVIDPRTARRTSALPSQTAEHDLPHPAPPRFDARERLAERRPLIDGFQLPDRVRAAITNPDSMTDLVRAILEAAGRRPWIDGDLLVYDEHAIIVLGGRAGKPHVHDHLNHAYMSFRESGAHEGAVIATGYTSSDEIRTREFLAPELVHVGVDAIQRMADAVAVGADPFKFLRPPVVRLGDVVRLGNRGSIPRLRADARRA